MFGDCRLTKDCQPDTAAIGFCKDNQKYYVFLDRKVIYKGDDPAMMHLTHQDPVFFRDYEHLLDFLRELPGEKPKPPPSRPADPPVKKSTNLQTDYDINKIVNMAEVKVSQKEARASPNRKTIQRELEKVVMGQKLAIETIAHQTALFLGKKNPKKPLSIMTYGPPGTGKTETAKALARILSKLCPQEYSTTLLDLNQFTEAHSVARLVGAPPSYVGYEQPGVLETIAESKYAVVIFDETDKANEEVLKVLMSVIDTGKCSARRRQEDGSNELDLSHTILFFTSNFKLGASSQKGKIGFTFSEDVEEMQNNHDAIEVNYSEPPPENEHTALTKRIYKNTEAARKAFIDAGVLPEISSRFSTFCEFHELSAEAKIQILAKMIIEAGFEYDVKLGRIDSGILQALIDAATTEDVLTVRSYKAVIEGNLAEAFAKAGNKYPGQTVRITGTIEDPIIKPNKR